MANRKISELTAAGALTGTELVEVVQGGVNKQTTTQDIADLGGGGGGGVTSVNGDSGPTVNLNANDIPFTPAGTIIATDVQAALQELDSDIINAIAGLKWKSSVRVATTADGTLATAYENGDTVDGVVLATGDRILIKNQATQTDNGIYTVNASGAPTRSTDADSASELESAAVSVQEGTTNANTTWLQTTDSITLGVSNIVWTGFGSSVPDADTSTKGIVELATSAETITGTDTERATTPAGVHAKVVGVQDLFVRAAAMSPRTTGGSGVHVLMEFATSLVNIPVLPFDQTTQEYAQFEITPPRKWNNGTITVVPYWTATSGSGTVRWAINGGMFRNDDALTVALGTAQNSDDTLIATNDLHIGPATSAITLAGTGQDANLIVIQVSRDPSNDTLTADALLIGISIRFTTDAAIDA